MKRRLLGCLALSLIAATAGAQDPFDNDVPVVARRPQAQVAPELPPIAPASMTPELYLYLQDQRRHDDPAQAVRRKAEFKAAQRMNRLATMKWFGMSNARPTASVIPTMGVYSPAWTGNGYDRFDWVGVGSPTVSITVDSQSTRR